MDEPELPPDPSRTDRGKASSADNPDGTDRASQEPSP